jgi:Tfp pilus assembly pilus retraction ATPase PilT
MEWLLKQEVLTECELLEALEAATGASVFKREESVVPGHAPPEARLLEQHGFLYLGHMGEQHLVAGGPDLPAHLEQYLGHAATDWHWVIHNPGRERYFIEAPGNEFPRPHNLTAWLRELIRGICNRGAHDIHFERSHDSLKVRFRSPSGMHFAGEWKGTRPEATFRLLKTWAGMNPAPGLPPQDGRMVLPGQANLPAFRLSHMDTVDGESAVLRIYQQGDDLRPMKGLGMPSELIGRIMDVVLHSHGMVLVGGPTGSGKTTTLYGILQDLRPHDLKVLTIEDPVEYELPGTVQSQVDASRDWTFDNAVRSFMRQDPDVIMLGELRDAPSAQAACRASLTGHAVLGTIHAASPDGVIQRLRSWGISQSILSESLRVVVTQKLQTTASGRPEASFQWTIPNFEAPRGKGQKAPQRQRDVAQAR